MGWLNKICKMRRSLKRYFTLILLLSSIYAKAQIADFCKYQKNMNEAELNIVANQKCKALDIYYNTLTTSKGNFCKDIYNAMLLANELNKTDTFFTLLQFIHTKGLSNEYLNNLEVFSKLHSDKRWQEFLIKNEHHPNIDWKLRAKMDSLYYKDQYFRKKEGSYKVYGDTIEKIDDENIAFLLKLMEENRFPGEDDIGVSDIRGGMNYSIVLLHYVQRTSKNKALKKITPQIIKLLKEGKLEPNRCAADWIGYHGTPNYNTGMVEVVNFIIEETDEETKFYKAKYTLEQKQQRDKIRRELCLEPLENYYKKLIYILENPQNYYAFDVLINKFHVNMASYKSFIKNMEELK